MKQILPTSIHNVPFIPEKRIARKANQLISEYFEKKGRIPSPPISVEQILQKNLGYSLSYDFLEKDFGFGVLGAVFFDAQEVRLDTSLSEEEGRHDFTVGHEIGHLVLHANLLKQTATLSEPGTPSSLCRSNSCDRVEVQANKFAAYLLMPEGMIRDVWEKVLSAPLPLCIDDYENAYHRREPFVAGNLTIEPWCPLLGGFERELLFEVVAARLAPYFKVSTHAMRIRLEELGCFTRRTRHVACG